MYPESHNYCAMTQAMNKRMVNCSLLGTNIEITAGRTTDLFLAAGERVYRSASLTRGNAK